MTDNDSTEYIYFWETEEDMPISIPYPSSGVIFSQTPQIETAVNALNEIVGQIKGRAQDTHELKWGHMGAAKWWEINRFLNRCPVFYCRAFSHTLGEETTKLMLHIKSDAKPLLYDESTGLPSLYEDCVITIQDTGNTDV